MDCSDPKKTKTEHSDTNHQYQPFPATAYQQKSHEHGRDEHAQLNGDAGVGAGKEELHHLLPAITAASYRRVW